MMGLPESCLLALGKTLVNVLSLDDVPGLTAIATTKSYLKAHKRRMMRFLRGVYEGYVFTVANPAAALRIHWKTYPQQKPKGMSIDDTVTATLPTVQAGYEAGAAPGADGTIGGIPMQDVQKSIDFMAKNGVLPTVLDTSKVVDLSGVAGANVFDIETIKSQAATWKP